MLFYNGNTYFVSIVIIMIDYVSYSLHIIYHNYYFKDSNIVNHDVIQDTMYTSFPESRYTLPVRTKCI